MIRSVAPLRNWAVGSLGVLLAWQALSTPVMAKSKVETGADGTYDLSVMSWSEIPFRSVVRQQYDFSCGSAAVATLLSFNFDHATTERPVFAAMWQAGDQPVIRKFGFSMLDIKRYLDRLGFTTEGFRLTIDELEKIDRPGIIILDLKGYKHFVVVKGITSSEVVVGDPMLGLMRYSFADLAAHWNGIFLTIVDDPGHRDPHFNIADELVPWSGVPLSQGVSRRPLAQITNYLPSFSQISPVILAAANGAVSP